MTRMLKCVYINSDGGKWIRAAENYVGKSRLVADRFHLMKYINRVARYTANEGNETKERFYRYIYKDKLLAAKKLLTRIRNHCEGSDRAVKECRTYLTENWEYIQRAFHDKHVLGCSAKVIDLVRYRRERELMAAGATGTEGMIIEEPQRRRYTAAQREAMKYAEALHGSIAGGSTVCKILAIREQIGNI